MIRAISVAAILFGIAAIASLYVGNAGTSDKTDLISDQMLRAEADRLAEFAESASQLGADAITIKDSGIAVLTSTGKTVSEFRSTCLLGPTHRTFSIPPKEPALIIITNGSELYVEIMPSGITRISSPNLSE